MLLHFNIEFTPKESLSLTHFVHEAHDSPLPLRNTRQHLNTAFVKNKINNKEHKNVKNGAPPTLQKATFLQDDGWNQIITFFVINWNHPHLVAQIFCCSLHAYEWPKSPTTVLRLYINFGKWSKLQKQNLNEDRLL